MQTSSQDLTKGYDYERLVREEIEHYKEIEITDKLKEGGAHANSSWAYYWTDIVGEMAKSGYYDLAGFLSRSAGGLGRPVRILSLASGYCGHEIELARKLNCPYEVTCTDINVGIFEKAKELVKQEGLRITFAPADLNFIDIAPSSHDLIFAHASLHHVINLERLFEQIRHGLAPGGILCITEVVGKNRTLIWEENERFANALLELLPRNLTQGARLAIEEEPDGMEGVRQEDILPLLHANFHPKVEIRHGAFMRFICTHADIGRALDPSVGEAKRYLDFLIECDRAAVRHGVLRPLELWGVYSA
jgi:SAM-dependent methyltransferase